MKPPNANVGFWIMAKCRGKSLGFRSFCSPKMSGVSQWRSVLRILQGWIMMDLGFETTGVTVFGFASPPRPCPSSSPVWAWHSWHKKMWRESLQRSSGPGAGGAQGGPAAQRSAAALFERVKQYYALANEDDYQKNGQWQLDLLRIDLQLLEAHRRHAGLPDLEADDDADAVDAEDVEMEEVLLEPEPKQEVKRPLPASKMAARRVYRRCARRRKSSKKSGAKKKEAASVVTEVQAVAKETGKKKEKGTTQLANKALISALKGPALALTSDLKKAQVAKTLIDILEGAVDDPFFSGFHAQEAYYKLSTFSRRGQLQLEHWNNKVLLRLHHRVREMVLQGHLNALNLSNVLLSIAHLSQHFGIPSDLVAALIKCLPAKTGNMSVQSLSNSLWASFLLKGTAPGALRLIPAITTQINWKAARMGPQHLTRCLSLAAQLKDETPAVLEMVSDIAAQIKETHIARDVIPQHLDECLMAAAQLKDAAPEVLQIVPAIATQITQKAGDMKPPELSNCLWASVQLKDVAPVVLEVVPAIALQIREKAKRMTPHHLSTCLEATAQLKDVAPEILELVPALVAEVPAKMETMDCQGLSDSRQALELLQEDFLRFTAARLIPLVPKLRAKRFDTVVNVVWSCAKARVYPGELLHLVSQHLGSRATLASLADFGLCALAWSYQVLDSEEDFADFQQLLKPGATPPASTLRSTPAPAASMRSTPVAASTVRYAPASASSLLGCNQGLAAHGHPEGPRVGETNCGSQVPKNSESQLLPAMVRRLSGSLVVTVVLCVGELCLLWRHLSFVQAVSWGHRATKGQVTERFGQRRLAFSRKPEEDAESNAEAEARRLMSSITKARSAKKLLEILDGAINGETLNFIHATAVYIQLATLKKEGRLQSSDWDGRVLLKLHAWVKDMVLEDQLPARETANVLWSMAELSDQFRIPSQLLVALAQSVPEKVGGMVPQALANCLWACLQLENEGHEVSQMVPAIILEVPSRIEDMDPRDLCNTLDALILLQESVPRLTGSVADYLSDSGNEDGIVWSAAAHLNTLLPKLTGNDLTIAVPAVIWACAKVSVHHDELLASAALRLGSPTALSRLKDFGLCALSWAYQVLDVENDFTDFRMLLKSEIEKRGLSEADVESSRLGHLKWNNANV
eukprot:s243_g19.t1